MCTATHFVESWLRRPSSVRKKSARSRSSMFTKTTRARPSSSASLQAREVPTSTPMTAETRDERAFHHSRGAAQLALEGRIAGDVDEVDLAVLPARVLERHRDRELALVLVVVGVGDGRPGLDRAEAVDRPRLEEKRLDERRLSRPAVADDGDVADPCGLGHGLALLLGACGFRSRSLVSAEGPGYGTAAAAMGTWSRFAKAGLSTCEASERATVNAPGSPSRAR